MARNDYSNDALNNLSAFHRKRYVVYVEGPDDEPFWNEIFSLFGLKDFYIKVAGGKPEIEKREKAIIEEDVDIIVARDCDYTDLLVQQINHRRILYTYGYSIENSLYSPVSIAKAIAVYSRRAEYPVEDIELWLESLMSSFSELLLFDIANEKFKRSVAVMGNRCSRFLMSERSHQANPDLLRAFVDSIRMHFLPDEIKEIQEIIEKSQKPLSFIIRGHFLTNAISNFIKNKSKTKSLPHDLLYGHMIDLLQHKHIERSDILFLKQKVELLLNSP